MKKVPTKKIRRKRVYLSREDRAAREAENMRRAEIETRALDIESKRIDGAKATAIQVLERRSASWGDVGSRWEQERQDEAAEAKTAAKDRRKRNRAGLSNTKLAPVQGQTITGERVMVDQMSGRFLLMMRRSGWPRELAEACAHFEHDYQLSRSGIRSQSLEPHVDGGRSPQNTAQIEALQKVRLIEALIDPDDWLTFVLWAGHGMSITDMHSRGWGVKDELGRRLRRAATRAAAFYHSGFEPGVTRAHREMRMHLMDLER